MRNISRVALLNCFFDISNVAPIVVTLLAWFGLLSLVEFLMVVVAIVFVQVVIGSVLIIVD